ncbi:hypothetical protein SAMN05216383_10344 [Prevotella sp. KH2C16]|nr:hypothetical protein SAMN05216383_10344 [Prevotella sp. KH2C16]
MYLRFSIIILVLIVLISLEHGGFHKQVQSYAIFSLIMFFGLQNPFFFLGLLFNFSIMFLIYSLDIPLKSVFFGMCCLMRPFMFSMAPFSHEQY